MGVGHYGTVGLGDSIGVWGYHPHNNDGQAVYAWALYGGTGVYAKSGSGMGVYAEGGTNGVRAKTTATNGAGVLTQGNEGVFAHGNSHYDPTGLWGWADNSGTSPGGSLFGVRATSYGDGSNTYALYAEVLNNSNPAWAGYFNGDVYATSYSSPSDIKFKKNIAPMTGSLAKIMALKPKTYDMKREEFQDKIILPRGKQYGLIAQELEAVFPELVRKTVAPAQYTLEEQKAGVKKASTEFKSVEYQALIPILIQAIQEQQAEIEALKRQVAK